MGISPVLALRVGISLVLASRVGYTLFLSLSGWVYTLFLSLSEWFLCSVSARFGGFYAQFLLGLVGFSCGTGITTLIRNVGIMRPGMGCVTVLIKDVGHPEVRKGEIPALIPSRK